MTYWKKEVGTVRRDQAIKTIKNLGYKRSDGENTINWEKEKKLITVGPFHIWFFNKDDLGQWVFDSKSNFRDPELVDYIKYFTNFEDK